MLFDGHAKRLQIVGDDLKSLRRLFSEISAAENPAMHDDIARRLAKLFHSGVRDPGFLRNLASPNARARRLFMRISRRK